MPLADTVPARPPALWEQDAFDIQCAPSPFKEKAVGEVPAGRIA